MKAKILLVEDDAALARGLSFNLEQDGHEVRHVERGAQALAACAEERPDLVVLDLNLPDLDGLEVLERLRQRDRGLPVLCLTARGQETDVVMGLRLGADDYVTKPFGLAVLRARIEALLRRATPGGEAAPERVRFDAVEVDLTARRVVHPDREEELTPIEAEILHYLLARRGRAVERATMLRDLWGVHRAGATRTLDNHVARLRRKLEPEPAHPRFLVTVHGTGYRLAEDGDRG